MSDQSMNDKFSISYLFYDIADKRGLDDKGFTRTAEQICNPSVDNCPRSYLNLYTLNN